MNKKAFTLVELIVVITILAVLATVAFISFQGYGQSARDSTRLSDLKSMEKILDLSKLTNNRYPTPVNSTSVTYSGSVAWTQGVFGQTAYTSNASMSNVPIDPVTSLEYAYSITSNGQEYQLAAVLENPVTSTITQSTYAGTQEAQVYVKGNYNGQFLKVRKNNTTYLLGVPSILTSDIVSSQLLEDILTNKRLVYNGHKNLPSSFSGSIYKTDGGFDFGGAPYVATEVILFEGDIEDLETNQAERVTFFDKLQASYSGSVISDQEDISELLRVDSSSASSASNYVASAMNNSLKTSITIQDVAKVVRQTPSNCVSNPNPDSDFIFDAGTNTITGHNLGNASVSLVIPCIIGGIDVLYIGDSAFESSNLTSIIIPEGVIGIGVDAFYSSNLITSLTLSSSVTSIGDFAFSNNRLATLTIPDGVISIGDYAFHYNPLLTLTIPNNVISIGEGAFSENQLTNVIIGDSVTTIGYEAFSYNELTSLTLGDSVTTIGTLAFSTGNQLASLTIPASVTSIGSRAFQSNKLEINTIVIRCSMPSLAFDVFKLNGAASDTDIGNPNTCVNEDGSPGGSPELPGGSPELPGGR